MIPYIRLVVPLQRGSRRLNTENKYAGAGAGTVYITTQIRTLLLYVYINIREIKAKGWSAEK